MPLRLSPTLRQACRIRGSRRTPKARPPTASTSSQRRASDQRMTGWMVMASVEADAGIYPHVGEVGEDQADDVEQRADEDHRPHHGEVLGVDGVDGVAAEAGDAEEGFCEQAAQEKQGNH